MSEMFSQGGKGSTGNTQKVLAGGDKVGFMFDGNTWIQM